jgi:hypothetical protein
MYSSRRHVTGISAAVAVFIRNGTFALCKRLSPVTRSLAGRCREVAMNGIVYLVGLVVIVLAILSFLGLR